MSAQWTGTSSHCLIWEFSSPPTYWIGFWTWARSGSRRGDSDCPAMTGPGEPGHRSPSDASAELIIGEWLTPPRVLQPPAHDQLELAPPPPQQQAREGGGGRRPGPP